VPRPQDNPRQMLVEGYEDLYSVHGLMRAHIDWPDTPEKYPVWINIGRSDEEILRGLIPAKFKERYTRFLGVVLDADTKPNGRYDSIRNQCLSIFPTMPKTLPTGGLIVENEEHQRLGAWIMPDNLSDGCLEVFLRHLVPDDSVPVWTHAVTSTAVAKTVGAGYRDCDLPKANLYAWLAWQDEPAQRAGEALTKKLLDPHAESAAPFVRWFRELYQL
jgi:uncharacterized protein DUF3226